MGVTLGVVMGLGMGVGVGVGVGVRVGVGVGVRLSESEGGSESRSVANENTPEPFVGRVISRTLSQSSANSVKIARIPKPRTGSRVDLSGNKHTRHSGVIPNNCRFTTRA